MAQFGKGKELVFEAFRELMIVLLGDAGTRDSMLESFFLVSKVSLSFFFSHIAMHFHTLPLLSPVTKINQKKLK